MPPLTPTRKRLTLSEKQKIIEDSKLPGFNKAKTLEKYGIGRSSLAKILHNQRDIVPDLHCTFHGQSWKHSENQSIGNDKLNGKNGFFSP